MTELIRYDAMCTAIAECERVDEVKDIRDKAQAIEAYARQAQNTEAERQACNVRLRAERRVGQILKDMEKSGERAKPEDNLKSGPKSRHTTSAQLKDFGISRDQSSRWQKLASVDDNEFESALADPEEKPSTNGIIRKANGKTTKMDPAALWVWGRLRDFERQGVFAKNRFQLLGEMTETMHSDIDRIIPQLIEFLQELYNARH